MTLVGFFGPPGSGKGTQSQRLRDALGIPYLATGDLIREVGREDSPLGERMRSITLRNAFAPDDLMVEMVIGRVLASDEHILDGFPRTLPQALAFDAALAERGRTLTHAIMVDVADDVLVDRIVGRRLCGECARPYHVRLAPPALEGICDECGAGLVERSDDRPDKIAKRLSDYRELTEPTVAHYRARGVLHRIDGARPVDEIAARVLEICR